MGSSVVTGTRQIGPIGTIARICVGAGLLIFAIASQPSSLELLAGLLLLPIAELAILFAIRPPGTKPLHLYGPIGYAVNFGTAGLLLALWTNPALLFYGASI